MINIFKTLGDKQLKTKMILQVHDELVFDLFKPEEEIVREIVRSGMESALALEVPVLVDMNTGANWLEAH